MKPLKNILQKPQMRPFETIFIKEVHEGVFKNLVLNCTINRDTCKRTCLIGTFTQHLIHFWLGFLGLLFRWGVQNYTPLTETCYSHKK